VQFSCSVADWNHFISPIILLVIETVFDFFLFLLLCFPSLLFWYSLNCHFCVLWIISIIFWWDCSIWLISSFPSQSSLAPSLSLLFHFSILIRLNIDHSSLLMEVKACWVFILILQFDEKTNIWRMEWRLLSSFKKISQSQWFISSMWKDMTIRGKKTKMKEILSLVCFWWLLFFHCSKNDVGVIVLSILHSVDSHNITFCGILLFLLTLNNMDDFHWIHLLHILHVNCRMVFAVALDGDVFLMWWCRMEWDGRTRKDSRRRQQDETVMMTGIGSSNITGYFFLFSLFSLFALFFLFSVHFFLFSPSSRKEKNESTSSNELKTGTKEIDITTQQEDVHLIKCKEQIWRILKLQFVIIILYSFQGIIKQRTRESKRDDINELYDDTKRNQQKERNEKHKTMQWTRRENIKIEY